MSTTRGEIHVDLDHVVFPFHDHFQKHMPKPISIHDIEDYTELDIVMDMPPTKVYQLIGVFLEHPDSQAIGPIEGAKEAHNSFVSQDLFVRYVTARERSTEDVTRAWLETHITDGEEPALIFTGSSEGVGSKQEAFARHNPFAVIDDSPKHILEAIRAGVRLPMLFGEYPWSKSCPEGATYVRNWTETSELIIEHLAPT